MHLQVVSAGITIEKTTSSQPSPMAVSYQTEKVSSQPGKCINEDLQDPNRINGGLPQEGR